jgi:transcriptional regulator with XRE-family HTH domain
MVTTLGEVIIEALERLGKSQLWLAGEAGVSAQAVTKWIQTGQISRENAIQVAPILGVSLDALLAGASIEGAQIGEAISELPDEHRQQVLDFIRYKFERSEGMIASDKAAHYVAMIDRIKSDMAARQGSPTAPKKTRR